MARADIRLYELGLAPSREKARADIGWYRFCDGKGWKARQRYGTAKIKVVGNEDRVC